MKNSGRTYSATIGKDYTSILGLAYYHTAEDEYSNIGISDTSAIEVKYVAGKLDSKISGTAYPNGVPKDKWRLISVPTNLDFKTVNVANDPAQDDYYGISVAIDNDY